MLISAIDDCNPNPCENGGTCTDGINAFTCDCEEDFTGLRCEQSKLIHLSQIWCVKGVICCSHLYIDYCYTEVHINNSVADKHSDFKMVK